MSRLATFKNQHEYSICRAFEPSIYECQGCRWHIEEGRGKCTVPSVLYTMGTTQIEEFVEAICLD